MQMPSPNFLFTQNAEIERHTITTINGITNYAEGSRTPVKCRFMVLSGAEAVRQGGDRNKYLAHFYLPASTNIRNEDHLIYNGNMWYITAIRNPGGLDSYIVVDAERPIVEREIGLR